MKKLLTQQKVTKADVKRAIQAAMGNMKKAEQLLDLMQEFSLTKHQKKRIVEFGEADADASADSILASAMVPRVEETMLVRLPEEMREALEHASKELDQEAEDLVT